MYAFEYEMMSSFISSLDSVNGLFVGTVAIGAGAAAVKGAVNKLAAKSRISIFKHSVIEAYSVPSDIFGLLITHLLLPAEILQIFSPVRVNE